MERGRVTGGPQIPDLITPCIQNTESLGPNSDLTEGEFRRILRKLFPVMPKLRLSLSLPEPSADGGWDWSSDPREPLLPFVSCPLIDERSFLPVVPASQVSHRVCSPCHQLPISLDTLLDFCGRELFARISGHLSGIRSAFPPGFLSPSPNQEPTSKLVGILSPSGKKGAPL